MAVDAGEGVHTEGETFDTTVCAGKARNGRCCWLSLSHSPQIGAGIKLITRCLISQRPTTRDQANEIQAHHRRASRQFYWLEAHPRVRRAAEPGRAAGQDPQRRLYRHRPGSHRRGLLFRPADRLDFSVASGFGGVPDQRGRPPRDDGADVRERDRSFERPRLRVA